MSRINYGKFLAISLTAAFLLIGCASNNTIPPPEPTQAEGDSESPIPFTQYSVAEAEEAAGFDVKEPQYLPSEVTFAFATVQEPPFPNVTSFFNYADRGAFIQIVQEPKDSALQNPNACGTNGDECESIQFGELIALYRLTPPTESVMWEADGFVFHLLRTAGEPDTIYKDELLKIVKNME